MADQTHFPLPTPIAPLVGREREQATLLDALTPALAGKGGLVLLGGEAGIGKTTLAEWLLAKAVGRGALVLVGRCYDLAETPPYGPWVEVFDHIPRPDAVPTRPDLATGTGAASQAALFAGVRDYLVALAAQRPLVLLLDDLHWADPATLDLLRFLNRQLADVPLLLLVTYRADELTRRHLLYTLLPLLEHEGRVIRLDLKPLDADALLALIAACYALPIPDAHRLVTWLLAQAEGNTFFTAQLLRALEDTDRLTSTPGGWALGDLGAVRLPTPLRQVLDARIDRLGEAARGLLSLAAVLGQEVSLALWAALAGVDEETLFDSVERAVEARLLAESPDGTSMRFSHALVREALYDGLLVSRRRRIHLRVAESLLATTSPDPDMVAYHLQRAGDPRAVSWLLQAGERASRAWARLAAATRFEAALALLEQREAEPGERGWLLLRTARLYEYGDNRRALERLGEALALAGVAGDRALAVATLQARGAVRCLAADFHGGLADMAASVAGWDSLDAANRARISESDAQKAFHGLAHYALWLALIGRFAEGLAQAEHYLSEGGASGSAATEGVGYGDAQQARGYALAGLGRPEEARLALSLARETYRTVGHHGLVAETTTNEIGWVILPYQTERVAEREQLAVTAQAAWDLARGAFVDLASNIARRSLAVVDGHWREAIALAVALRAAGGSEIFSLIGTVLLAEITYRQGDNDLTVQLVREILPGGPDSTPGDTELPYALTAQRLAAAVALDVGDLPRARAWLTAHDRWLAWSGGVRGQSEGQLAWAAYHRAVGTPTAAREHAERALILAGIPRQPLALLAAYRLLGELATAIGAHAAAERHLDAAMVLADACAAPYERGLTLLAIAELRVAAGNPTDVAVPLAEARATFADLGAAPALARADALVARRAAAAPAPAALPFGLTAREAEVLSLVAQGLSNAEIAARLFLSVRTVEQHLRAVYAKLDAPSRTAATRLAIVHGLAGEAP